MGWRGYPPPKPVCVLTRYFLAAHFSQTVCPHKGHGQVPATWAIFARFVSHFWLCTIVITYLPTYNSSVLHVNLRDVSSLLMRRRIGSRHDGNWFIASRHTLLCPRPLDLAGN